MSDVSRYERGEPYSTHRDAVTYRGLDPLTGLDVLIYDFAGRPTLGAGSLSSERILNVVNATVKRSVDGESGTLVAALPSGASLVAPGEAVVDDRFVLQALEGALDASRHELVHGDINPSRILYAKGRVYLEGYGVPWSNGRPRAPSAGAPADGGSTAAANDGSQTATAVAQALQRDLQALVRSLLELAGDNLSAELGVALRSALAPGAYPPMTAQRLFSIARRLAGGAVTVPTAGFTDLTLPITAGKNPLASEAPGRRSDERPAGGTSGGAGADVPRTAGSATGQRPATPPPQRAPAGRTPTPATRSATAPAGSTARPAAKPAAASAPGSREARSTAGERAGFSTDPDPITLNSDPGVVPVNLGGADPGGEFTPRDTSPGFVKDLPPGATYRPGNLEESPRPAPFRFDNAEERAARVRSWRGPALLLLLFLTAGFAAYLAFMADQSDQPSPTTPGLGQFTIEVSVSPTNLPPVQLVVDESPASSTYRPGTVIGSVPRKVQFDVAGTYVVHAVFRDRVTDSVSVVVPDDGAITLVFPPAAPTR